MAEWVGLVVAVVGVGIALAGILAPCTFRAAG